MKTTLLATAVAVMMLTGCNQAMPDTHDADVKAIRDNETQWNADWVAKDLEKLMAHYADDAILGVPGGPAASGKDAIRAGFKEMVADPALSLKFSADKVEVAKSGDVGYTQGKYQLTVTDAATKQ